MDNLPSEDSYLIDPSDLDDSGRIKDLKAIEKRTGKKINIFFHEKFMESEIGELIYKCIEDKRDYNALYRRAYDVFVHNQGKPATITPEPIHPREVKGDVTKDLLTEIEITIACQYTSEWQVLCHALGRDPVKQIEWDRLREEENI